LVKGISRRVIVIKSPDPHIFDEAIFIVKEDTFHKGVTNEDILREAQTAANNYLKEHTHTNLFSKIPPFAFALIGAFVTAAIWICSQFLF